MEYITAFLTAVTMVSFAVIYIRSILQGKSSPALMTWITFLVGTGVSLGSYIIAGDKDMIAGVLNTMDVLVVISIVVTIFIRGNIRGKRKMIISTFEVAYFTAAISIIIYGYMSHDAVGTNNWVQVLITIGYWPTLHKMRKEQKNTEPFNGWTLNLVAAIIALYPAIANNNSLAITYAIRTLACTATIMLVMTYYEWKSHRKHVLEGD